MVRECLAVLALVPGTGCSLILDFSESAVTPPDAAFSQAECDFKEPNNALAEAALFDPADVGPAAICTAPGATDDRDFYKLTVPAATSVTITITFVSTPTGDLDLKLTDTAGATLGQSRGFGDRESITCPGAAPLCSALAAGDYVFEVFPAQAGMTNRYDIAVELTPM
ncbi:MAG: PPC domain-containing protein [Myxococcota bacterium]|nr:PPC domain-containing protein [Myxococcota bacterium]